MALDNPIKTIINQTEKLRILHGSVELTYVHGRRGSKFIIPETTYKKKRV